MEGRGTWSLCFDALDISGRNYFDVAWAGDTEGDYCVMTYNWPLKGNFGGWFLGFFYQVD
jgi:hypothetical protein